MSRSATTVILFFNKPALTNRCLESVYRAAENSPSGHRIILVDNGSREQDAREVASRATGVERLRIDSNAGFARGMNVGLRAAAGDGPIVLLSNDVELAPDFYERLAELDLDAPVLHCPRVHFLCDRAKPAYTHGHVDLASWELSHAFDPERGEIRFPDYYPAAATVWTPPAFERLGGFNERYFCYWEDVELAWRAARLGVGLRPAPGLLVHHQGRGTTAGKKKYFEHYQRGRQITMEIVTQCV